MLNLAELTELIDSARQSVFRLESLRQYDVTAADREVARYLAGEVPDLQRKQAWLDRIRARVARGVELRHLRIMRVPLSDYDRMGCEWSYPHNAQAGMQVRVLPEPSDTAEWGHDFYLLDGRPVRLHFDGHGRFVGAEMAIDPPRTWWKVADNLWAQAEPFTEWWAAHPEYHRQAATR